MLKENHLLNFNGCAQINQKSKNKTFNLKVKGISKVALLNQINKLGRKFFSKDFILICCHKKFIKNLANEDPQEPRADSCAEKYALLNPNYFYCSIKASKKIGKAVVRNKVKRRIRSCLYEIAREKESKINKHYAKKEDIKNLLLIFIPRFACYGLDFEVLKNDVSKYLNIYLQSKNVIVKDFIS